VLVSDDESASESLYPDLDKRLLKFVGSTDNHCTLDETLHGMREQETLRY
jgi:hypothetical protein